MVERIYPSYETEPMPVYLDKFYVIDFDRCLGSVSGAMRLMYRAAMSCGIDGSAMEAAQLQSEDTAGSFDVVGWIEKNCSKELYEAFIEKYLSLEFDNDELLEPGAAEFLQRLIENDIPFAIMTYGGETWQRTKLARAGLGTLPMLVTPSKEKGKQIATWKGDGKHSLPGFEIPEELIESEEPVLAREIVLIDDKAAAFNGLPEEARGYVIRHGNGELKLSQMGKIPDNVQEAHSFEQIADLENIPPLEREAA